MSSNIIHHFSKSRLCLTLAAIGLSAGCTEFSSADNKAVCNEFNSTINRNIKEIALSTAEGDVVDKSAMQQGARLTQNNNRLTTIMINLQLEHQNKCAPRQSPIDASLYSKQARECHSASLDMQIASYGNDSNKKTDAQKKVASACDFNAWSLQAAK